MAASLPSPSSPPPTSSSICSSLRSEARLDRVLQSYGDEEGSRKPLALEDAAKRAIEGEDDLEVDLAGEKSGYWDQLALFPPSAGGNTGLEMPHRPTPRSRPSSQTPHPAKVDSSPSPAAAWHAAVPPASSSLSPSDPPFIRVNSFSPVPPIHGLPSPTPPASPPSPSYPFPRMATPPPISLQRISDPLMKPARPPLVSAFTTCTTIRCRSDSAGSTSSCWTAASVEDADDSKDNRAHTPPRSTGGLVAAAVETPEKANPVSLPLTPPSTARRPRAVPLILHPLPSAPSFPTFTASNAEVALNLPSSPFQGVDENDLPFFPSFDVEDTGVMAVKDLESFEAGSEFPWRWSRSYEAGPLPSQGKLAPQTASTSLGHAERGHEQTDLSGRRRTMTNGEIARIQRGLVDAAAVFSRREDSPKAKREALYVPHHPGSSTAAEEQGPGHRSRIDSVVSCSSFSSLADLPYVPAAGSAFELERLSSSSALRSSTMANRPPPPEPPSTPPLPSGLKNLRLAAHTPSPGQGAKKSWWPSSSPKPLRIPFRRMKSSSAPPPPRPRRPDEVIRASNASRRLPPTLSYDVSSLTSSGDCQPPSMASAALTSTASTTQPAPLLPSLFPIWSAGVPPLGAGAGGRITEGGETTSLRKALEAEQARTAALETEVQRLQRIVAELTGSPMEG
ncbi:hypothetical protein JCM10213_009291 [Rhodosporidiobolus nylandii]